MARSNAIAVIWRRGFADTDSRVRTSAISTRGEWAEFAKDSFLPWYRTGSWNVLGSQNYKLVERAREPFPPPRSMDDMTILTAYYTILQKRLIADGVKRSLTVEKAFQEGGEIPRVPVVECYGAQVHVTFWADFLNLISGST